MITLRDVHTDPISDELEGVHEQIEDPERCDERSDVGYVGGAF